MPKGKKTCPQCSTVVGCRTSICSECQYDFSTNKVAKTKKSRKIGKAVESDNEIKKTQADMLEAIRRPAKIYAPAGDCPIKLKKTTKKAVIEWADALKDHYSNEHKNLTNEGVEYFVRQFYSIDSDEYKKVKKAIKSS